MSETRKRGPGVRLVISYDRLKESDESGMVDITSEGAEDWIYSCVGSHHGMQGEAEGTDERVMDFAADLAALVRKHYGRVTPLLPAPTGSCPP